MTDSQTRNQSVDTFRLLAALCVVILHLRYNSLPSEVAVGMRLMSRWAIPFFFIISGYFLALKTSKTKQLNVLPTVERLIWMFILWVLLYSPFVVLNHDFTTLFKLIASPTFIYFGLFSHLWYLPALLFGYLFISFCHHYNIKILLPIISVISIGMALISGAYNIFDVGFPLVYDVARTWLSIPFLYVGFLFYEKGKPNWWISLLLVIVGAAAQVFEARYLYKQFDFSAYNHQFLFGTIPFAIGMAALSLSDLRFLQHPVLGKWGSEYSLGIYLIHPAVIFTLLPQVSRLMSGVINTAVWEISAPVIVVVMALVVLYLIQRYIPKLFNILFGTHIPREA
jgi:surface polysaccharide O-acyltransferase-like enzyme